MELKPLMSGLGLGLLVLAGCEPYAGTIPTTDMPQLVAPAEMPSACVRAASARYAQLPETLSVAPATQLQNQRWLVQGQYAASSGTRVFQCQYTTEGNMISVARR